MDSSLMLPRMDEEEEDELGSMSSFSEHDDSSNSIGSASSEMTDDASSSNSSLFEMSDLISNLPIKRGISNFFQGKSQSFTSLSNAISLEDLVKPERPYNKRLKCRKSYAGGLDRHRQKSLSPKHPAKGAIMKKGSSKASFDSLSMKKRSFSGLKSRSGCLSVSGQALLFA